MVEPVRRDVDQPVGEFEDDRVAHLEGRRVVELGGLAGWIASVIFGRQWPALTHHSPAVPSSTLRPSVVV